MEQTRVSETWAGRWFAITPWREPSFHCILPSVFLLLQLLSSLFIFDSHAQEPEPEKPMGQPYLSVFLTRSQPVSSTYKYLEDTIPSLTVGAGTGGGFKVGVYARPLNYALGGELELFAHSGKLSAPTTTNNGVTRFASQNFTMANAMFNVLARYPGDFIQPYVGAGAGVTLVFTDGQAQSAGGVQSGSHGLQGLAVQALAGARMTVTQHLFLFAEYKYLLSFSELDNCGGENEQAARNCKVLNELTYRSHYATVGLGFTFW